MSNMSYCRWENTYNDLKDCFNSMVESDGEKLSESEQRAKDNIFELMKEMLTFAEENSLCMKCGGILEGKDGQEQCPACGWEAGDE